MKKKNLSYYSGGSLTVEAALLMPLILLVLFLVLTFSIQTHRRVLSTAASYEALYSPNAQDPTDVEDDTPDPVTYIRTYRLFRTTKKEE